MPAIKHYLLIKTPAEKVYTALSKTEGLCGWWTTGILQQNENNESSE
jgi:uncharacterized protein YndB with AHSA1/START domain